MRNLTSMFPVVHPGLRLALTSDYRLEHRGDSVLGLVVTDLLRDTFPYLRVGPSAVLTHALSSRRCPLHSPTSR